MTAIREDYADGYSHGVEWGEQDRADGQASAYWLSEFRVESRVGSVWSRAFYLGALRGYRSIVRTLQQGRWGT